MPNTTVSLENFDFLQLLKMLADNRKTGVLTVFRTGGNFQAWLEQGQIRHLQMGRLEGVMALAALLNDSRGRFQFDEGRQHPHPSMKESLDAVSMRAIASLPERPMPFSGPARLTSPERVAELELSEAERRVLRRIEQQAPMTDLWDDPLARGLVSRLARLGLIKERKSRVARLTIGVTHEVRGVALVDELILRRWKEDLARHPQKLAIRNEAGHTYTFTLRSGPDLGTQLLLPTDLIMQTRLQAGESVLVKPV